MRARRVAPLVVAVVSTAAVAIATPVRAGPAVLPALATEAAAPVSPRGIAELPMYEVTSAGLTAEQSRGIADAFGIENALLGDGSVRFATRRLGSVPMKIPSEPCNLPRDEGGRSTTCRAFDLPAIREIEPISGEEALGRVMEAFAEAGVSIPDDGSFRSTNTDLRIQPRRVGSTGFEVPIDTAVHFDQMAGQIPLVGPGAKLDVVFDRDGNVTLFHHAMRTLEPSEVVPLIPTDDAERMCGRHYPAGSSIRLGLLYYAPPLTIDAKVIAPHYQCMGRAPNGAALVPALIPAVEGLAPQVESINGIVGPMFDVDAEVSVVGGTEPYSYSWHSLSTYLPPRISSDPDVHYELKPRSAIRTERLWVTITDANGLATSARLSMPVPQQSSVAPDAVATDAMRPRAVGQLDVGGEFNVWEWQCVKDSAAGFQSAFSGQGVPIAFKWTGLNAWEKDFRDTVTQSGWDSSYVDNVDLAWYTGHGSPNSFTFDNTTHDDDRIVPADARWGDRDLEWLQLESCQVLKFANSSGTNVFERWATRFDGLHLLNGFQTNAACVEVAGGTAGRFSRYLFPQDYLFITLSALRVRQAWAAMALDLEPPGRQYVSMGVYGPGAVTNYDDFFWGQGPVGPDIPKSQINGYWWLVGTV